MPGAFLLDDLPGMLSTAEFACTALIVSGEHGGESIAGQLDRDTEDSFGVRARGAVFHAPSEPVLVEDDVLEIEDADGMVERFKCQAPAPDGTGMTRYQLTRI